MNLSEIYINRSPLTMKWNGRVHESLGDENFHPKGCKNPDPVIRRFEDHYDTDLIQRVRRRGQWRGNPDPEYNGIIKRIKNVTQNSSGEIFDRSKPPPVFAPIE